jgi:FKBP-type peptidyl-prolyl cis-trans isomerase 2
MSQKSVVLIALVAVLLAAVAAGCASSSPVVKTGDNVTIDYVISFSNGTIWTTSQRQVAMNAGIFDANNSYMPLNFIVGNNNTLEGISDAVIGMKVAETKNGTISPEKAYGVYDQSLIKPFAISDITGDNNSSLAVGQPLFVSAGGGYARRVYVYSVDQPNNTVFIDYNNKMAGLAFTYQITLLRID